MFICRYCKKVTPSYTKTRKIYTTCEDCDKLFKTMTYINKNGKRTYVGNLSTGTPVYKVELNIEEEIKNLEDEISALKCALWKKNQKLLDLKVKLALQKQNKKHKEDIKRIRRETRFLLRDGEEDDEWDKILDQTAEEHLASALGSTNN